MVAITLTRLIRATLVPCLVLALPAQAKKDDKQGKGDDAAASDPYAAALTFYRERMQRIPFRFHVEAREHLAKVPRAESLAVLANDYATTKDYTENTRYIIASLIGRHFNREEFVEPLAALRRAQQKPVDAWLWVSTLRIQTQRVGDDEAKSIVMESRVPLHRACALVAMGMAGSTNVAPAIEAICASFPKKEAERNLLLGAMSGAIYDNKRRVNDEAFRAGLRAYIGLLGDEVGLTHAAKLQMARHLHWVLGGPALFVNKEAWLEMLERGEIRNPPKTHTRAAPSFCGVETDGERFCYVIDMSDSMCKEISPAAKPPAAAITGPRPPKKPKGVLPDESDLPWHKINTRWDLAREQLKISLQRLSDDKYFSIVWFGTESGTLDSCKGMIKATKANVNRVMAELDSIVCGKPVDKIAPDGVLKGKTNMHSGLRRAYGLAGRGYIDEYAYVDAEALTEGCDTIFLLSDGAPSFDDFEGTDKDYGEGKVVLDQEYGEEAPRTARINYPGPYVDPERLVDDVKRMNAFRRIRMHCIGIGEANMDLLKRLAEMGLGEVFQIGQPRVKKDEPKNEPKVAPK